jgi:hypothetical protein
MGSVTNHTSEATVLHDHLSHACPVLEATPEAMVPACRDVPCTRYTLDTVGGHQHIVILIWALAMARDRDEAMADLRTLRPLDECRSP